MPAKDTATGTNTEAVQLRQVQEERPDLHGRQGHYQRPCLPVCPADRARDDTLAVGALNRLRVNLGVLARRVVQLRAAPVKLVCFVRGHWLVGRQRVLGGVFDVHTVAEQRAEVDGNVPGLGRALADLVQVRQTHQETGGGPCVHGQEMDVAGQSGLSR